MRTRDMWEKTNGCKKTPDLHAQHFSAFGPLHKEKNP